ncbi:hypothetical protein B0A53_04012 [Rhodotorula sp. CCFEE 5036]|nr:hypothetical protein B0A53_04012 [Rhodotorula sp. CCFEE 5036]
MDLLAKNTLIATKDAGKLPVDWQSRIPALRRYWQAVQAHPGCFALVTAMTPNQAVASILSKDEIPTLSGELNTHALFQLEDIVRTKFSGNASGTQLNNIINNPPYVLLEVPPAVARKVNSPYGDAIPLMRSVQNFNGFHPLKTPTPNFLTVRCSDRWVLDLADLNVEIPLVCKDKLARFALDYFAVYGSSNCDFLADEVTKNNAPEHGCVIEAGYRHADRHAKRDPTLGGVYIKLNEVASKLIKDKGAYLDNFAKTYKLPPIDPHIASYALLNFYEKYLYEGTQTLVLGDLNDKTVSNMTQDDYNKRVSEIKQNLKSCQAFCPGNADKYAKIGLPQFFPSPVEKGASRCGACCILEHLCIAAGVTAQEIWDAFFINWNWRDKTGTYSRFSYAFAWATRCSAGCAAPTIGDDVYAATPELCSFLLPFLCALCIGRRKRELAAYMTWIENKFKVLESRGKSADRSKLMPKRIVFGHQIKTFNIGEDGQRRICTLCFRKDFEYHHDYKIKTGAEYHKILTILGDQPTLATLSAAACAVKAMPNHLLSLLEDFDLAAKYLAHDELEAFKIRLAQFAQSLLANDEEGDDGDEAEELEEDSELRH